MSPTELSSPPVGADDTHKQELDPALMASAKVVADSLEQSCTIGDTHHAIAKGLMSKENVYADLGEIVAGKKSGRLSDNEIIIFDSTGIAIEDAAAAALVYEKASARESEPFCVRRVTNYEMASTKKKARNTKRSMKKLLIVCALCCANIGIALAALDGAKIDQITGLKGNFNEKEGVYKSLGHGAT